jgi:hypothetical protein
MTKLTKYHLSLAGEYRVASELLKRGLNATVTFGNAKSADVIAYGGNRRATVIEVKTSQQKNFVTSFYNKYESPDHDHPDFWILMQVTQDRGEGHRDRFFILTHTELASIQAERNRAYRIRHGDIATDEDIPWERHYELSQGGVDNVLVTDVEPHEDEWDKIVRFCE